MVLFEWVWDVDLDWILICVLRVVGFEFLPVVGDFRLLTCIDLIMDWWWF